MTQDKESVITLSGVLEWMGMEGGFWLLNVGDKKYDLHADRKLFLGFKSGEQVKVQGKIRKDRACFHMCGIIFEMVSILH